MTARRLDGAALPRGLKRALALVAVVFALLWARHHGYLEAHGLGELARGELFRLHHVEFVGVRALDHDSLWKLTGIAANTPLVDLDPARASSALAKHPRIAHARAMRIPPDRLVIAVTERTPIAFELRSGLALDQSGARFPALPGEAERLPQLTGEPRFALPVVAAARDTGLNLASVEAASASEIHVRTLGNPVRLVVGRDARASFADWRQLSDSDVVESTGAQEVDLRFRSNPVLRDLHKPAGGENGETR
ncbi:MAG TPA: FtsQ-type POTRA domain-containing protein [Myxococcota bacterium]|nr:FtsQ-type POTRA domain-containing protein [Myxococcota bacterium]